MADYAPVPLSSSETYRLADMNGMMTDLRWVSDLCLEIGKMMTVRGPGDTMVIEALQSAALIRYGRCFKGGVRTAFQLDGSWTNQLPEELRGAHDEFLSLRDKHVAHSVNDWELNVPVAYLRRAEGERTTVASVSVQHHRVVGLPADSIEKLRRVAVTLRDMVTKAFDEESLCVLEFARALSIDELEDRLRDPGHMAGMQAVNKTRGRP